MNSTFQFLLPWTFLDVDKIVGYAVSYHLKHNKRETTNSKDAKLVLTSER
jgi:hypothetical protein